MKISVPLDVKMLELVKFELVFVKIDPKLLNREDIEEEAELVRGWMGRVVVVSCGGDFDSKSVLS